jgi:hypothetical protein
MEADSFERAVRNARPGEAFVYHVGLLSAERTHPSSRLDTPFTAVARRAWWLYERGFVDLVQRRLEPGIFEYFAVRKKPWRRRY